MKQIDSPLRIEVEIVRYGSNTARDSEVGQPGFHVCFLTIF